MTHASPRTPRCLRPGRLLLGLGALVAAQGLGCASAAPTPTQAYIVTPSSELASALRSVETVEQRWALARRHLGEANATYGRMSEAWTAVLDAVERSSPLPQATGGAETEHHPPGCAERLAQLQEQLGDAQRGLIGRRKTLSPEVLSLLTLEGELRRKEQALTGSADCR